MVKWGKCQCEYAIVKGKSRDKGHNVKFGNLLLGWLKYAKVAFSFWHNGLTMCFDVASIVCKDESIYEFNGQTMCFYVNSIVYKGEGIYQPITFSCIVIPFRLKWVF
jgi:hypothetical protein